MKANYNACLPAQATPLPKRAAKSSVPGQQRCRSSCKQGTKFPTVLLLLFPLLLLLLTGRPSLLPRSSMLRKL